MKKSLSICFLIVCIAFISGCVGKDAVPSPENVSSSKFADTMTEYYAIGINEIKDIGNGTYFEITDDELKEYPELIKSIRGEGCTKSDYGGWYCELNSTEAGRVGDFFERKHEKYLFSIDMKFENNLNDNIIDAELMNTFESNGFPLSENYSIITRSEKNNLNNSWFIDKEAYTPEYTIWEINDELKVYKRGYIEYQFTKIGEHYYEIYFAVS